MSKAPTEFPVGKTVTFLAGPTRVERTGNVTGHEGQFVLVEAEVKGKTKTLRTRPGAIHA